MCNVPAINVDKDYQVFTLLNSWIDADEWQIL